MNSYTVQQRYEQTKSTISNHSIESPCFSDGLRGKKRVRISRGWGVLVRGSRFLGVGTSLSPLLEEEKRRRFPFDCCSHISVVCWENRTDLSEEVFEDGWTRTVRCCDERGISFAITFNGSDEPMIPCGFCFSILWRLKITSKASIGFLICALFGWNAKIGCSSLRYHHRRIQLYPSKFWLESGVSERPNLSRTEAKEQSALSVTVAKISKKIPIEVHFHKWPSVVAEFPTWTFDSPIEMNGGRCGQVITAELARLRASIFYMTVLQLSPGKESPGFSVELLRWYQLSKRRPLPRKLVRLLIIARKAQSKWDATLHCPRQDNLYTRHKVGTS